MVRITSRRSPSVSRNLAAARSTSAGGGVSLTNRRTSFVAMKCAVDGCLARMSSTSFAVALAAAGLDPVAEHHLLADRRGCAARTGTPAPWRGLSIVHPVNARATSVTSFCV